ncbi:MAG: hypothetical protein M1822_004394 [Bathelium mastoideum]|nr:MAG: hypothetical protein M1822_004394 [Bathelium mastoideum]
MNSYVQAYRDSFSDIQPAFLELEISSFSLAGIRGKDATQYLLGVISEKHCTIRDIYRTGSLAHVLRNHPLFPQEYRKMGEIQNECSGSIMDLEALITEFESFETELTETSTTLLSFFQGTWSKRKMEYFEESKDNIAAQTYVGDVEVRLFLDEEYYKAGHERV